MPHASQETLPFHAAQTYHLELALDESESFSFLPGQFVSAVADDSDGKEQTRAYSIASAPDTTASISA